MSGPTAPNWAGNTRYIGPTGPAGQNAAAGGLTLFMDSATSTTVPTIGSLQLAPVLTAQTTISYSANNTTVLVAKFPTAVGAIAEQTVPAGLWDMNIYAATSSTTNAPSFYWSLYQVDADGSSNPVLISNGAANAELITNLVSSQTQYNQSLYVPTFVLAAGKRLSCYLYVVYQGGNRTATFEFRSGALSHIHTSIIDSAHNWSEYPAISDVDLSNYNITHVNTLNSTTISNSGTTNSGTVITAKVQAAGTGNLLLTSLSSNTLISAANGTISNNSYSNKTTFVSQNDILGNRGVDYSDFSYTNISNTGGKGGRIDLTADAGSVEIGGTTYSVGGLINITANSALSAPYNATSAIKMSAAGVNIYAGAFSSTFAPLGQLYLYGSLGTSLTSSATAPGFNADPLTNYIYATNGTRIDGISYIKEIRNYASNNLNIHPDSTYAVDMTKVQFIGMGNASNANLSNKVIRGDGNSWLYNFSFVGTDAVNTQLIYGVTTINNATLNTSLTGAGDLVITAYQQQNLTIPITYSNYSIKLIASSNIELTPSNSGSVIISNADLNMSSNNISNITSMIGSSNLSISTASNLTIGAGSTLTISNANNSIVQDPSNTTIGTTKSLTISNVTSAITMPYANGPVCTGGEISYSGGRKFHTFTSNGTFSVVSSLGETIEVMLIGGGGGGGSQSGGGGGAGNMIIFESALAVDSYGIGIGTAGSPGVFSISQGGNGGITTFGYIASAGGGGGGGTYGVGPGKAGGCGGGGAELGELGGGLGYAGSTAGVTVISNLYTNGGYGIPTYGSMGGCGGGGTSAAGGIQTAPNSIGANGGAGTLYRGTYYGGGGGGQSGGTYNPPYTDQGGLGGIGGGGNGGLAATNGQNATGYGSGGGAGINYGGAGSAGVVIVSYEYSADPFDIYSATGITLSANTVAASNDVSIGGDLALSGVMTTNLDITNHDISNVAKFNAYVTTPIQNPGYLQMFDYTMSTVNGTKTFQIYGTSGWDGSAIKVGNLPAGVYNVSFYCTNNDVRHLNGVLTTPGAACVGGITPTGNPAVAICFSANAIDVGDYVWLKARTTLAGSVTNMYLDFNNTSIGSGDDFIMSIVMISAQWDGTMSWVYT
jgi:hypothetical protein